VFIVDTKKNQVSYDPKGKKSPEAAPGVFYLGSKEDVAALSGSDLLDVFNATATGTPDLKVSPTARFSTRETGERRTWGLFVQIKALAAGDEDPEEGVAVTKSVKKAEPKPKKPKAAKAAKETSTKVLVAKGSGKPHELRAGTTQARMLELISPKGGIAVEDWIAEMNKHRTRGKWHRDNAWSGLRYNLVTLHRYTVRLEGDRFYLGGE